MKKVYRFEDNSEYWDRRWAEAGEDADTFEDLSIYPIRYAEMVMSDTRARALELGCGLGRVLKHYARKGFAIEGVERSAVAVARLQEDPGVVVCEGDVLVLPYDDQAFDVVMAFGVLHNLETGIEKGVQEMGRILKPGGRFCISMRPDNWEMGWNERYWRRKALKNTPNPGPEKFHKMLVKEGEFKQLLADAGLVTDTIHRARNVSILYRVPWLQQRQSDDEAGRRSAGYRLNGPGRILDSILRTLLPYHTANVLVFVGHKKTD